MSFATSENRMRKSKELLDQLGHTGRTTEEKIIHLRGSFYRTLEAPKVPYLDEWMDEKYFLPSESASEHGLWRTQRFPFLKKIARKLSPQSPAKEVGVCKGSQIGVTTVGVGWKLYIARYGLGPTLFVQPTRDSITEYSEQKLQPAIDLCKDVQDKLGNRRPKHLASTKLRKYFPGGYISLGSSNSAPTLRSKSIKNLDIDEEDGCNQDVNDEGSSIHLAIRRTANFPDSKLFRNSTPINTETSSIEPYCKNGTAERYLVPCPECNPKADKYKTCFEFDWDLIKYTNKDSRTTVMMCPDCGSAIEEHHKTWMMDYGNGFWYRYNPTSLQEFENDDLRVNILIQLEEKGYHTLNKNQIDHLEATSVEDDDEEICTFFISALYSPLGFYSWQEAVKFWLEANAKNDKGLLKTFLNTVLGKSFSTKVEDIDHNELSRRKELYSQDGSFDIPMGGLAVSMGVDVQGDRLEATIKATGLDGEEWLLDYQIFMGDTSIMGDEITYKFKGHLTCWGYLDEYLKIKFLHQTGHQLPIECTMIDARYRSKIVFEFCKRHRTQKVFGVYGKDGWGEGVIKTPVKPNRYGVRVYDAMQDELKFELYSKLRNEEPGPNYIHFSRTINYPSNYFKGLVIEELRTKRKGDTDVLYWYNPPGGRNEPLDTWDYATVAFLAIRLNLKGRIKALEKPPRYISNPSPVIAIRKEITTRPKKKIVKRKKK